MSSYSSTYPSIRPSFQFNADAGRLDSRISYTRSTTGSFYGKDKHLSSDNLLTYSENFGAWSQVGLFSRTGGQTDPAGGSTGFTLRENSSSGYHRNYLNAQANESFAFVVYAKQNSGTRYLCLTLLDTGNDWESAIFDLAGGAPTTVSGSSSGFTNVSVAQTASGNGYYKCVLKVTGYANTANVSIHNSTTSAGINTSVGLPSYTGDGTSSIDVAFASLSTTGATDYNFTSGQIHREYAPTLQTAAINAPRFEYSPTDSASMGLLIEGSSTNLVTYSETLPSGWIAGRSTLTAASGVAPDGTLTSNLWTVDGTAAQSHNAYYEWTTGGATPQTASIYAKAGNVNYLVMRYSTLNGAFTDGYVSFNLSNGTVGTTTGTMTSSSIESCGNGWYRCSITSTALTNATGRLVIYVAQADNTLSFDGNSYDHIQVWGGQIEANQSHASSYIKSNSGSATTRALDSASMDLTQAGFNGGPFTVLSETEGGQGQYPRAWALNDSTASERVYVFRNSATSGSSTDWYVYGSTGGTGYVTSTIPSSASAGKLAVSFNTNDVSFTANGNSASTDPSAPIPSGLDTLKIGTSWSGGSNHLNGHIKRLALYGEALSDTNLQALTS